MPRLNKKQTWSVLSWELILVNAVMSRPEHLSDQGRLRLPSIKKILLNNRPSQKHLFKGNIFLANSFFPTFSALFFKNVFSVIIGPIYDRRIIQSLTAMRASTTVQLREIVSDLTTTFTQRILIPEMAE